MTRHRIDLFSLVAGVLALGTAAVLLVPDLGPETLSRLFPVAVIALGVALLLSAFPQREDGSDEPAESEAAGGAGALGEDPATLDTRRISR